MPLVRELVGHLVERTDSLHAVHNAGESLKKKVNNEIRKERERKRETHKNEGEGMAKERFKAGARHGHGNIVSYSNNVRKQ